MVFHIDAEPAMPSPREMLESFLGRREGQYFCGECLSRHLGLHSARTTMATLGLRYQPTFDARDDVCSECGRRRFVIRRVA